MKLIRVCVGLLGNFDGNPENDFTTVTGINLPVKSDVGFSLHNLTELETDELNDQYTQSWLLSSVARHKGVSIDAVSAFLNGYTFSTSQVR